MLRSRLRQSLDQPAVPDTSDNDVQSAAAAQQADDLYQKLKGEIHWKLVDNIDLVTLHALDKEEIRKEIRSALTQIIQSENIPLNQLERERLIGEDSSIRRPTAETMRLMILSRWSSFLKRTLVRSSRPLRSIQTEW